MVFKYMFFTKASINRMGLSTEIVFSKDEMIIWLREIPVMCCMFKNMIFAVLCRCFSIFEGNKTEVFSQTDVI